MSAPDSRRVRHYLPARPLLDAIRGERPYCQGNHCPHCEGVRNLDPWAAPCMARRQFAEALGTTTRTLDRWRRYGVPADRADALACRVGFHPSSVWGIEWEAWADLALEVA